MESPKTADEADDSYRVVNGGRSVEAAANLFPPGFYATATQLVGASACCGGPGRRIGMDDIWLASALWIGLTPMMASLATPRLRDGNYR